MATHGFSGANDGEALAAGGGGQPFVQAHHTQAGGIVVAGGLAIKRTEANGAVAAGMGASGYRARCRQISQ
ncbi:MAG: hypothetical protein ACREU2_07900 [Steroidobacteraceae bacterium]